MAEFPIELYPVKIPATEPFPSGQTVYRPILALSVTSIETGQHINCLGLTSSRSCLISDMKSFGFEAVAGPDARVVILGTLPGAVSLEKRQYYAQPRNAFWTIMSRVAGIAIELPYEQRLQHLVAKRYALWDVCHSARRQGSLDSAIRSGSVRPNDFEGFLASHRHMRLICFNGAKAGALFDRLVAPELGGQLASIRREILPSTSPAHASMSLEQKIEKWRNVLLGV